MWDLDDWVDVLRLGVFLLVLFFGLILVSSCGPGQWTQPLKVTASPKLYPVFEQVADAINAEAGAELVVKGYGVWMSEIEIESPPDDFPCGYFSPVRNEIGVRVGCGTVNLIIAHELGHAFGLEHSDDPKSIMFQHTAMGWTTKSAAVSLVLELRAHGLIEQQPTSAEE